MPFLCISLLHLHVQTFLLDIAYWMLEQVHWTLPLGVPQTRRKTKLITDLLCPEHLVILLFLSCF